MKAETPSTDLGLGPATRLLWRSPQAVHLELGDSAVIIDGLDPRLIRRIASPVADRGLPEHVDETSRHALTSLAEAGYLWTRPSGAGDDRRTPPAPRLAGELTSLAVRYGEDASQVLAARRRATVAVFGANRAATHIAALLAAGGVGRVHCTMPGNTKLAQAVPGGLTPDDEGRTPAAAVEDAIRRAAPEVDTTPLPYDRPADLTVLALDGPVDEDHRTTLHATFAAHLVVALGPDHGAVGPLVVPGLTSCLRCADLHRRDRDPAWPALAMQLAIPRRYGPASDVTVATITAGVAAQQALSFLEGGDPACIDGTIEMRLPDWRLRRRSWPTHAECDCALR